MEDVITVEEFLKNQSRYKNFSIYVHVRQNKFSSSGRRINISELSKHNPHEFGWIDDDTFNLGYNISLKKYIWKGRVPKHAKK